ncbi:unnamed protein product [Sphagnum jensenii]
MREKLAVPEAEWPHAIAELSAQNHIEKATVLSTCNLMEIYVVALSWNRGVQEVTEWMSKMSGIPVEDLLKHLFILRDNDAIQHLFRVSAGLDSLVLGEGLFKQAITAGKWVRNETSISAGAVSVSSAAVELAVMKLSEGGLPKVNVCVGEADVVFMSTASNVPLFFKENVKDMPPASQLAGGVQHFIDISVPRNVAACLTDLPSTKVYNVDDLKEVVAANKERRQKALEAQVIIDEELQSFKAWHDSLETVPTIKKLQGYAEHVHTAELEKCLGKMGEITNKECRVIEDLSRGIVNKLLHGPMQHLQSNGTDSQTVNETLDNMHAWERMFNLAFEVMVAEGQLRGG